MKILHLLHVEKFTSKYIEFINSNFDATEHSFFVYPNKYTDQKWFSVTGKEYLQYENVRYTPCMDIEIRKPSFSAYLEQFDKIVLHSAFILILLDFFYNHPNIRKKLIILFWGGDVALSGIEEKKKKKKCVVDDAKDIIALIPQDKERIQSIYNPHGKIYVTDYYANDLENNKYIEYRDHVKHESDDSLYIQIGNSGTESNQHIKVFQRVKKFKDENIKVFVPLSYGDSSYINKVIDAGRYYFGNKFFPMCELLNEEEYLKFTGNINIGIFNISDRQQALGNIYLLLKTGAKIYLPEKSILRDYYEGELGIKIFDIEGIEEEAIDKFCHFDRKHIEDNYSKISSLDNVGNATERWKEIFNG